MEQQTPPRSRPMPAPPTNIGPPPIALSREDRQRGVAFAPDVQRIMMHGVDTITAPLAATLGPLGRAVVIAPQPGKTHPELLTDAATIARRVTEVPNRYSNTGAMLIRSMVWQMRETVGDGSATAAVLARALIAGGLRVIAAGANPMIVRRGIEQGVCAAVAELAAMAQPLETPEAVAALVRATTGDASLADLVAEIFDIVGVDGTVVVEEYAGTVLDREYVEGVRWYSGLASPQFVTDPARREAVMTKPLIVLADLDITSALQIVPVLELAMRVQAQSLVIIAPRIDGEALGTLLVNQKKIPVAPIKAAWPLSVRTEIMQDLAILTGATLINVETGRALESFRVEDFGGARRVIVDRLNFTIAGAYGRQKAIRARVADLKAALSRESITSYPDMLRRRIANLSGGVATLKVGAISENERQLKRLLAEDALRCVRAALEEGSVPGGGAAYLACIPALETLRRCTTDTDEATGVRIVEEALSAPLRQIATNAGYEGSVAVAQAKLDGSPCGFDALAGRVVNMREAGIIDPTKVTRRALEMAASAAAMFLTTEAVVLTKRRSTLA